MKNKIKVFLSGHEGSIKALKQNLVSKVHVDYDDSIYPSLEVFNEEYCKAFSQGVKFLVEKGIDDVFLISPNHLRISNLTKVYEKLLNLEAEGLDLQMSDVNKIEDEFARIK